MNFFKDLFDKLIETTGGAAGGLLSPFSGMLSSVGNLFSEDGVLSMDNLVQAGTLFALAEGLSSNEQKKSVQALRKEYESFLPAFTQAKIAAGKAEAMATDDVNALLNYGVVTERNADGQVTKRTKGPLGGSEGLKYEELYGVKPQYEVDKTTGNIRLDETGNPVTVRTGRPGQMQIANEAQREEERKAAMASTRTRVDQMAESGKPLAQQFRRFERELSPEVQRTQRQAGKSFRDLLRAQDPTKLSGSEMANVERGLGRMGIGLGRTSEMDKYKAAMTFGDALANKQQRLGQALGQTGNVTASLRSNVNPGSVFGEGTTTTPTMPGQVTGFGNTAATALAPVANIIQSKPGEMGGKEALQKVILPN